MKLPNKIRIGFQEYDLIRNDEGLKTAGYLGLTRKDDGTIEYFAGTDPGTLADTLIHEVLHGIVHNYFYQVEGMDEEGVVTMMAHGLTQVIKDNPEFVKVITKLLKGT